MNSDQRPRPEIAGHTLEGVIGVGSTAVVWSGRDAAGRPVAIKVPHEVPGAVELAQGQIERHILQAVRHEHLVHLRDVVGLADGRTALVFDQVRGASLDSTVTARGALRPGESVTVLTPIAEAVATLHAAGGTHGDISARNVLITAAGKPMLADLGAARLAGAGAGAVQGTPGFVAPEVREGVAPGEASDVFALGALAWFCLTGNGAPDTMMRLDPATIVSHVGPQLAPVIGACIDPDPSRRPTAAQLGALFFGAAPAEPIEVVVGADEATALTNRLRLDAAADTPAPPARGRFRVAAAAAAAAAARLGRWAAASRLGELRMPERRLVLTVGLVACTALVAAWAFTTRLPALGSVGRPALPSGAPPTLSSPPGSGPGPGHTAPTDPTRVGSVGERPDLVLQELADRRAEALTRRDVTALAGVHRNGAASSRQDTDVIERLRSQGQVYSGLHLIVAEARVLPAKATRNSTEHVEIRGRVDVSSYTVTHTDGTSLVRPATRGTALDFGLVQTSAGWRIESISDPRAT